MGLVRPSPVAILLAVLLPGLVLLGAARAVLRPPEVHGYAEAFDRRLRDAPPEVVVLGSSLAHRGIDLAVLARELGLPRDKVEMLQLPHASAAHWYAILENRVFRAGYRPRLVIVAGALTTMLNHDLLQVGANVDRLVEQLGPDEPVLAERVFGFDDPARFRALYAREAASRWRTSLLDGVRDRLLAATFTARPRLDEATRLAERVNESVFANERMDYALHRQDATGVGGRGLRALPPRAFDLRTHGLVGEMAALARAHDARLVWVRMPFPPSNRDVDVVPPEIEADALAWMEETGAGWLDLRSLDLSDDDFEDMRHLSRQGAVTFTAGLARALRALDGTGEAAVVRGVAVAAVPEATGSADPLPKLLGPGCERRAAAQALAGLDGAGRAALPDGVGLPFEVVADGVVLGEGNAVGCDGSWRIDGGVLVVGAPRPEAEVEVRWRPPQVTLLDGGGVLWIAPGAGARFHVEEAWTLPQAAFVLLARGRLAGEVGGASLHAAGTVAPLRGSAGRLGALVRPAVPGAAWDLEVRVDTGGAPLLLHHLAVGAPPATTAVLGRTETLHGASVRLVGGRLDDTRREVRYAGPPPFGEIPLEPRGAPRDMAAIALPKLADLADAAEKDAYRPSACSPLRVVEDGTPLPLPHELCYDVLTKGGGRACHAGPTLYFSSTAGGSPLRNGRRYTLTLDPDRTCATLVRTGAATLRGSSWLYPGDDATFTAPPSGATVFRDGAGTLVLTVLPRVAAAEGPLVVEVLLGERVVASAAWTPPEGRREATLRLPLDPPLPARPQGLAVRLRNTSAQAFHLVTLLALEEEGLAGVAAPEATGDGQELVRVEPLAVARVGEVPPLPAPGPARPFLDGAHEADVFAAWPVSNPALEKAGLGSWSPLRVRADGEPLQPVATRKSFRGGCDRCFLHLGQAIVYRAPAGGAARLEAFLDPDAPMRTGGGGQVWWLYPGQRLELEAAPVGAEGALEVRVVAFAAHPQRERTGEGLVLEVGDDRADFVPGERAGDGVATLGARADGRFPIRVVNGSDRGFALVRSIDLWGPEGVVRVLESAEAR